MGQVSGKNVFMAGMVVHDHPRAPPHRGFAGFWLRLRFVPGLMHMGRDWHLRCQSKGNQFYRAVPVLQLRTLCWPIFTPG